MLGKAGTAAVALIAGCVASPGTGRDDPTATASPGTERSSCPLSHEIFDDDREHRIEARYEYGNLSSAAKTVFDGALAEGGKTYRVENTAENKPTEFDYTDVVTYYEIEFEGEIHVVGTWSGRGCTG
jgi:hypothetical protein